MALARKTLKDYLIAHGVPAEKVGDIVDYVIDGHTETVDGLKADRDKFKTDAEKLPIVQAELDKAKEGSKDDWKIKYDDLKKEFDGYKTGIEEKDAHVAKETAYRALLKEIGVAEKRHDAIVHVADLDKLELVDGKFKDPEKMKTDLKTEWAEFITTTQTQGQHVENPPGGAGGDQTDTSKMTDAEYFKYMREKASEKKG